MKGSEGPKEQGRMASAAVANIEAIARLEEQFLETRTFWQLAADTVAGFTGSITFVLVHVIGFCAWLILNSGWLLAVAPFDPYPFTMLGTLVSCEAVLLSTFVLMKQKWMSAKAEQRDQLHLQIALLTEKELTKVLQTQQQIAEHLGIRAVTQDHEVREMSEDTAVDSLARELQQKLPTDPK